MLEGNDVQLVCVFNCSTHDTTTFASLVRISENVTNNDISLDTRKTVERVCFAGLTTLACLLGIPANVLNCLVFWCQGLRDRMNLCLFSMALTDFFLLMCVFAIFSISSYVAFYDGTLGEEYYLKTWNWLIGATYGFRLTSGCISMIIAVERCVCVVFPLRAINLIRTSVMGCLLLLCLLLIQGTYFILIFSFRVVYVKSYNYGQWMSVSTEFYEENKIIVQSLASILLGTVVPVTTFSTVLIATIITVVKLRISVSWRAQASSSNRDCHRRQMALTWMLVAVSCVYIITMMPFVTWQVAFFVLQDLFYRSGSYNLYHAVNAVVQTCPQINSSVHFLVYYRRSSRFRLFLREICHCMRSSCHLSKKSSTGLY